MKTIVVYRSKSGFVQRYAEWIAGDLKADLLEESGVTVDMLVGYDAIVYGGGLYESGINGIKTITGSLDKLEGKRIAVFASGASPARKDAMDDVIRRNFTAGQLAKLRFFYLRGGFDFTRLRARDKALMMLMKGKIRLKKLLGRSLHSDETGMLAAFGKPVDFVKRKNVAELVAYIRNGE